MLSEKVKYISVAQLVHEIFLKTFQIEFSNFCNFVNFFNGIFLIKRWSSKIIDSEVLPQPTHLKMTKSKKSYKIVPLWWKNQTFLVILEPQVIWNSMVVYRTTELRFLELLLNPNCSWLLLEYEVVFAKLLGKKGFHCDYELADMVIIWKNIHFCGLIKPSLLFCICL